MIREVKALVTEVLTPFATAILLDPSFGLEVAGRRSSNAYTAGTVTMNEMLSCAMDSIRVGRSSAGRITDVPPT